MDHDFTVWFSKSFGLFYLIALSVIIVAYAFWPSNKKRFDEAAQSILGDEDKPHREQVMAVEERDPHTGYMTTGHEWNGIKELNTPVPRPVYFFLIATALFSVVYWVLMPAWPLGVTYTKGLLGIDQRTTVSESLAQAALERSAWSKRIEAESFKQIQADPRLMENVRQTGRTLFGDNCAPCHGSNAQGGKGFPNLTTASWLWGGDPESIAETIRVGINSAHPQSRTSQMMAFGRDGMLKKGEVDDVVAYVRSLSDPAVAKDVPAAKIEAGKAVFAANCVTCHGDNAKGKADLGAPDLTDRVLDLRRRRRVDLRHRVGRPARPHAELGRQAVAARPQDSRALSVRSSAEGSMSATGAATRPVRTKAVVWPAIGAGLLLLLIANSHLVYVAIVSQPECVAHVRQGEGSAADGKFSAARSSCTPR